MATLTVSSPNRFRTIGFWALKIVVSLLFLATAGFKFSGAPDAVAEFNTIGLGQWFRYVTGLAEAAGAILLLIPVTAGFGAIVLFGVSVGAFLAQALVLHMDVIHTLVLILVTGGLAWVGRDQVLARFGRSA